MAKAKTFKKPKATSLKTCRRCGLNANHQFRTRRGRVVPKRWCGECMKLYQVWDQMKRRCHSPTAHNYDKYGAVGIIVCEEWRESFEMWATDMGPRPGGMSIERLDRLGAYAPDNCVWATPRDQMQNTMYNVYLTLGNETYTIAEWGRIKKIHKNTLGGRYMRGWDVEDILNTPPGQWHRFSKTKMKKILRLDERGLSAVKISKEIGVSQPTISRWLREHRARIKKSIEQRSRG